jgi:hypothetical protein
MIYADAMVNPGCPLDWLCSQLREQLLHSSGVFSWLRYQEWKGLTWMWVDPCRGGLDTRPQERVVLFSTLLLSLCTGIFCQVHELFCHSSCHSSFTAEPSYLGLPVWTKDQGLSRDSQVFGAILGLGKSPALLLGSYWVLSAACLWR